MTIRQLTELERLALDPDPRALGVFGFALLASPQIKDGKITLSTTFSNRMQTDFDVVWVNSHYFIIEVRSASGVVTSINSLFPPPLPSPPPLTVKAGQDYTVLFNLDTSMPPYAGKVTLDAADGPYAFRFAVNSPNFRASAEVIVPVAN